MFAIDVKANTIAGKAFDIAVLSNNNLVLSLGKSSNYCNNRVELNEKAKMSVTKAVKCDNKPTTSKSKVMMPDDLAGVFNSKASNCNTKWAISHKDGRISNNTSVLPKNIAAMSLGKIAFLSIRQRF